jgi:hypothetical protein
MIVGWSRAGTSGDVSLWRRLGRTQVSRGGSPLYVSDAKVDILIDDLTPSLREQFDLTLKGGVPGVVEAQVGLRQVQAGRFARAKRLSDALAKDHRLGAIDEDKPFFRGRMLAAWGFWNRHDTGYADVVFYHGFADAHTFVGIGGSAYHTMERANERMAQHSNSGIQMLMEFLRERSRDAGPYRRDPPGAWESEAWEADHDNPAVPEPIEFVAERYLDDQERGIRTIITAGR